MPTNNAYVIDDELLKLTEKAIGKGLICLGSASSFRKNPGILDTIFDLALKNNLPIDFHVDESDEPEVTTLDYIAERLLQPVWKVKLQPAIVHPLLLCLIK